MTDNSPFYRVLAGGMVVAAGIWMQRKGGAIIRSTFASSCANLATVASQMWSAQSSDPGMPESPIAVAAEAVVRAIFGAPGSFMSDNKAIVVCCAAIGGISLGSLTHRLVQSIKERLGIQDSGRLRRLLLRAAQIAGIASCYVASAVLGWDAYVCRQRRSILATWAFGVVISVLPSVPAMIRSRTGIGPMLTVANSASATLAVYLAALQLRAAGPATAGAAQAASTLAMLMSLAVLRGCELLSGIEVMWPVASFVHTTVVAPACRGIHAGTQQGILLLKHTTRAVWVGIVKPTFKISKQVSTGLLSMLCKIVKWIWAPIPRLLKAIEAGLNWLGAEVLLPLGRAIRGVIVFLTRKVLIPLRNAGLWAAQKLYSGICQTMAFGKKAMRSILDTIWKTILAGYALFKKISGIMRDGASWMFTHGVIPLWNAGVDLVLWFWASVLVPLASTLKNGALWLAATLRDGAVWVWLSVLVPAMEMVGNTLLWVWHSVLVPFMGMLENALIWAWLGILVPAGKMLKKCIHFLVVHFYIPSRDFCLCLSKQAWNISTSCVRCVWNISVSCLSCAWKFLSLCVRRAWIFSYSCGMWLMWAIVNVWAPSVACVTAWTFGGHAASHIGSGDIIVAVPHALATMATSALALMLVGQTLVDWSENLERAAIRRDGLHASWASRSLYGKGFVGMSKACGHVGRTLKMIGVFSYVHSDLGVVDFLGWAYIQIRSVIGSLLGFARDVLGPPLGQLYRAVCLFMRALHTSLSLIVVAIWTLIARVTVALRTLLGSVLGFVWKVLSNGLRLIYQSPWISLIASFSVAYFFFYLHSNSINLMQEAQAAMEGAMRLFETKIQVATSPWMAFMPSLSAWVYSGLDHVTPGKWHAHGAQALGGGCNLLMQGMVYSWASVSGLQQDSWRCFESKTFAAMTACLHLTVARAVRYDRVQISTIANDQGFVKFGRAALKLTVMPIVTLSAVSSLLGLTKPVAWILGTVEWVAIPMVSIYVLFSIRVICHEWIAWSRTGQELSFARERAMPTLGSLPESASVPAAAARSDWLEGLPTVSPSDVHVIPNRDCVACMETHPSEEGMRLLGCGHRPLCDPCLIEWLDRQRLGACCPYCRSSMFDATNLTAYVLM